MMTYDKWKTTEPDPHEHEPFGICDVCDKERPLFRKWVTGIETWCCEECLEQPEPRR